MYVCRHPIFTASVATWVRCSRFAPATNVRPTGTAQRRSRSIECFHKNTLLTKCERANSRIILCVCVCVGIWRRLGRVCTFDVFTTTPCYPETLQRLLPPAISAYKRPIHHNILLRLTPSHVRHFLFAIHINTSLA